MLSGLAYSLAFYCLTCMLNHHSMDVVYAIWSGLGIVLISLVGWWLYGQRLDAAAIAGMALLIAGVAVMQLFCGATTQG